MDGWVDCTLYSTVAVIPWMGGIYKYCQYLSSYPYYMDGWVDCSCAILDGRNLQLLSILELILWMSGWIVAVISWMGRGGGGRKLLD